MREPILINPQPQVFYGKYKPPIPEPNQIIFRGIGNGFCDEILFGSNVSEQIKDIAKREFKVRKNGVSQSSSQRSGVCRSLGLRVPSR